MDSPLSSRLRFRNAAGEPIAAPAEWQEGLIEVDAAAEGWHDLGLWVQGQRLEIFRQVMDGKDRVLARWARSGPGRYRLRLRSGELEEERLVKIAPRKLSPEAFVRLLEDLERRLPVAVALGLRQGGALTGVTVREPREISMAEEVERLRCALEGTPSRTGLLAVLAQLARDPHRVLATTGLWTPRERLRRPDAAGLRQALWRADNLDADRLPRRAIDLRVEPWVDVFENRLVKTFAGEVELRLRWLATVLGVERSPGAEVAELLERLVSARRAATFLAQVTRLRRPPKRPTMVLMKRPAYRAAYEGYLDFHRGLAVLLDAEELEAPLENLPYLYELWGTLQVLDALLETAGEHGDRVQFQRLVYPSAGGFYVRVVPGGEPLVRLLRAGGGEVVFFAQRSYTGKTSPLRSLSYDQAPDVAVELTRPGVPPKVFLFDPKYKLKGEADGDPESGRPKKVDIDKMHAYRDAIRDAHGHRVIAHASILYPGADVRFAPGLQALQAVPGQDQQLRARLRKIFQDGFDEV